VNTKPKMRLNARQSSQNPKVKVDPNQVRVTVTTRRDAHGRVTGTSSSRSLIVPANLDMNQPDLSALTNGDVEYILVKVSRKKRRCWGTYLNGEDPDIESEIYIGTTVSGLLDPRPAEVNHPQPPRLARVQLGEMVERRIEESARARVEKQSESTREGTHTRFRMQTSEPEGGRRVLRETPPQCEDLTNLTSYFNPFGGSPTGDGMLRRPA
jgi:hypothetical protein